LSFDIHPEPSIDVSLCGSHLALLPFVLASGAGSWASVTKQLGFIQALMILVAIGYDFYISDNRALDAETEQPVCFTTATAARTVGRATPDLLDLAGEILDPQAHPALVLADTEHYTTDLLDDVTNRNGFELLVPMSNSRALQRQLSAIPHEISLCDVAHLRRKKPLELIAMNDARVQPRNDRRMITARAATAPQPGN